MAASSIAGRGARRKVGGKAGLTINRVIEVARTIDPEALTMQSVADALGVDRKALNHHVHDRNTLMSLVALDAFSSAFSAAEHTHYAGWEDACRDYARRFTTSVIATGPLSEHIHLLASDSSRFLEPTEALLGLLIEAGLNDEDAMRSAALLTNICFAFARDVVQHARMGTSPRAAVLRAQLALRDGNEFPILSRIAGLPATTYDERQFSFSIDAFIHGVRAMLQTEQSGHQVEK